MTKEKKTTEEISFFLSNMEVELFNLNQTMKEILCVQMISKDISPQQVKAELDRYNNLEIHQEDIATQGLTEGQETMYYSGERQGEDESWFNPETQEKQKTKFDYVARK